MTDYFLKYNHFSILKNYILKDPLCDWFEIHKDHRVYQKDDISYYKDYIIKESDWVAGLSVPGQTKMAQAPLPPPPRVNPQLVTQQTAGQNISSTGLTATETALLSNEEKAMRLRQRGMA